MLRGELFRAWGWRFASASGARRATGLLRNPWTLLLALPGFTCHAKQVREREREREREGSVTKKMWCCRHTGRGCPPRPRPPHPPALPFDCSAGYSNWMVEWSAPKKTWCCQAHEEGML